MRGKQTSLALFVLLAIAAATGCKEEEKYVPRPAHSGASPSLGAVPDLPKKPEKAGADWTVWGAGFVMRSPTRSAEIVNKEITVVGYVVKTNLPDVDPCAVHPAGKADPEGCTPPVPTFWLADEKGADLKKSLRVMGFASNYAQLYEAIEIYKKAKKAKKDKIDPVTDAVWGIEVPNPLPVAGMKVRVTGTYGANFTKVSTSAASDPEMGILTYSKMEVVEPVEEVAILPGMKP